MTSIRASFNPFVSGVHPVGVRTTSVVGNDGVGYPVEMWYPAPDAYRHVVAADAFRIVNELPEATQEAIRDAAPTDGRRPLIMYWHGGYGHRREMAALCVFFASHGFVVAAPDFPGDHITYMYGDDPEIRRRPVDSSAEVRGRQAAEVIECLASGADEFAARIVDSENVGSFGLSLGGFTVLAANTVSRRIKASFAIAPGWGTRSPVPQMARFTRFLRFEEWKAPASTFLLTGGADALVIVDDVRELHARLPEPKRLAVLKGAGHLHWVDDAELMHETLRHRYLSGDFPDPEIDGPAIGRAFRPFSELCPAQHAVDSIRSIGLAHFAATLSDSDEARSFLADLARTLAQRGIDLDS
jgi:dienelactone hydrolase